LRAGAAFLARFFVFFAFDFFALFFAMIHLPIVAAIDPKLHADKAATRSFNAGGTCPPVAQSMSSTG
jgi:hypothetical protein